MGLYLYGVIPCVKPVDFGPIGFEGRGVQALPYGGVGAVLGEAPRDTFTNNIPREELVKLLLAHQQTLEKVMQRFFVLPFKFGTTLKDESELTRILGEGAGFLTGLIGQMRDHVEIDVVATWVVSEILREISEEDPEIAACKRDGMSGLRDPASVGMLLAQALKRRAEVWRRRITEGLRYRAEALADHDLLNDEMVLNASFLIHSDRQEKFFKGVEEVDRSFAGKLQFRCVGPLPPYSFATVTIKRFDPARVEEAATVLQLGGRAELSLLKRTYRALSRELHPDAHPGLAPQEFERLSDAYQVVADYCKDGPRSLERKAVAQCLRLEVAHAP